MDPEGDTVWYYLSEARIAGVQALDDGRLMMTLDDQRTRIIDMLGNTLAEYAAEMAPATQASPVRKSVHGVQTLGAVEPHGQDVVLLFECAELGAHGRSPRLCG